MVAPKMQEYNVADKKETVKLMALLLVLAAWMVFIFGMSANNGDDSQGLSDRVAAILASAFVPGFDGFSAVDQQAVLQAMSFPIRKAAHFTEYAILGALAFASLGQAHRVRRLAKASGSAVANVTGASKSAAASAASSASALASARKRLSKQALIAIMFSFAYAVLDEFHQLFVAGRCGQPFDVLIDTLGAITAVVVICAILFARADKVSAWKVSAWNLFI